MARVSIHKIFYDFKRGKIDNWTEQQIINYNKKVVRELTKRGLTIVKFGELDDISPF